LKAVTMPTAPSGCHCSVKRWRGRSEAMVSREAARQPDCEVADVDHLLDFTGAFRANLAGLQRDQLA